MRLMICVAPRTGRAASILTARAVRYTVLEAGVPGDIIKVCSAGIEFYDQETKEYLEKVDQLPDHKLPEVRNGEKKKKQKKKKVATTES
jgi:hypothetical protein